MKAAEVMILRPRWHTERHTGIHTYGIWRRAPTILAAAQQHGARSRTTRARAPARMRRRRPAQRNRRRRTTEPAHYHACCFFDAAFAAAGPGHVAVDDVCGENAYELREEFCAMLALTPQATPIPCDMVDGDSAA